MSLSSGNRTLRLEPAGHLDSVHLSHEAVALFNKAVSNMCGDDAIGATVAAGGVEKRYQDMVHRLFFTPEEDRDLVPEIDALVDGLRSSKHRWEVLIPLVNLHFDGIDELQVGNVRIRPKGTWLGEYYADLLNRISTGPGDRAELGLQQVQLGGQVQSVMNEHPSIAIVPVECDGSLIVDAAVALLDPVLDLLRSFGATVYSPGDGALIGRIGEVVSAKQVVFAFSDNRDAFDLKWHAVGPVMPYQVTPDILQHFRERLSLSELSDLMAKPFSERTKLEERILVAIRYGGDAAMAPTPEQRIVHHCAALEALLMRDNDFGEKIDAFCDRVAWVFGADYTSRKRLREDARQIYKERSEVMHRGKIGVPTELATKAAILFVGTLARLARNDQSWSSVDDVVRWVESMKLGGGQRAECR